MLLGQVAALRVILCVWSGSDNSIVMNALTVIWLLDADSSLSIVNESGTEAERVLEKIELARKLRSAGLGTGPCSGVAHICRL